MRRHEASLQYISKVLDGVGRTEFFDLEVPLLKGLREAMGSSGDATAHNMILRHVSTFASAKIMERGPWACAMCCQAPATRLVSTPGLYRDRNLVVDLVPLTVCRSPRCEQDATMCSQEMLTKLHMETMHETRGFKHKPSQPYEGAERSKSERRREGASTWTRARQLYKGYKRSKSEPGSGGVMASYNAGGWQLLSVLFVFLMCYVTGITVIGAARSELQ